VVKKAVKRDLVAKSEASLEPRLSGQLIYAGLSPGLNVCLRLVDFDVNESGPVTGMVFFSACGHGDKYGLFARLVRVSVQDSQ